MTANFMSAADAFGDWRENVLTGNAPKLWPCGEGDLARIELGPGIMVLLGGCPGAGKSALATQLVVDAVRMNTGLKALIANCEMPAATLLDRQLARLSGIDCDTIRFRRFEKLHADPLDKGLQTLEAAAGRLAFLTPPFSLENIAASADAFEADLILIDYVQRFDVPGQHADKRASVNRMMDFLRRFCDAGIGLVTIAAVGRTKDAKGRSSYAGDGLNLASFRESSELEYGCDSAFIVAPNEKTPGLVTLKHLKNRHGECRDLELRFVAECQRFESLDVAGMTGSQPDGKLSAALRAAWAATAAAGDGPQPFAEFEDFSE